MDLTAPLPPGYVEANRWDEFYVPTTITFGIMVVAIILRFAAGVVARKPLWYDDYAAFIAAASGISIYAICSTVWKDIGYGRHVVVAVTTVDPNAVEKFLKSVFALELLYCTAITAAKLSILAFLWRIFSRTSMRYWLIGLSTIAICWELAVFIASVCACIPVHAFWDLTITEKKCFDTYKSYIGISFPNLLTDFAITLLPIPYVWMLQISKRQKILVAVTLVMGGATCVISAVRLANIINNFSLADPTWDTITLMKWTAVEVFCATTSICLPTLRPIIRLFTTSSMDSAPVPSRPSNPSSASKRFGFGSGKSSKLYRSADLGTDDLGTEFETESERGLRASVRQDSKDGFGVQSYPMNAIEVRREFEVRQGAS